MTQPPTFGPEWEAEARAMAKAMETGELPPRDKPYRKQVEQLARLHWDTRLARTRGRR